MQRRTNLCVLESIVSTTKRRLDRVRNSIDFTDSIRSAKALTSMLLPVVIFVSACSFASVYLITIRLLTHTSALLALSDRASGLE